MQLLVLVIFGATCLALSLSCFLCKWLLLADSRSFKLSRAAEYVGVVELLAYALLWYSISVTFTVLNKWLYSFWEGGFPFPIMPSAVHTLVKLGLSRAIYCFKPCRPVPAPLPSRVYWRFAVPIGVMTALDIMLSNWSFRFINVTFYTIAKSASLLWILMWALLLKLVPRSADLLGVVSLIVTGLFMASWGESSFSLPGLLLIFGAGFFSAGRWAVTQLFQGYDKNSTSALTIVYHIAVPAAVAMTLPALVLEVKPWLGSKFTEPTLLWQSLSMAVLGGAVAFLLVLVEIKLVEISSSLSMGVFGSLKEVITIIVAALSLDERPSILNIAGLGLALSGSWLYKSIRQKHAMAGPAGYDTVAADADREVVDRELAALDFSTANREWDSSILDDQGWDDYDHKHNT
ncbi:unnamed protein product [Chrysoparadoxa australica]